MPINLHDTSIHAHAGRAHSFNHSVFVLIAALLASACFPPQIGDGDGDSTADTETGFEMGDLPGDGDGDGDPGDGDGDPNCEAPTVACDSGECWASDPSWTAEAMATLVDGIVTPGIWVPVGDLGTGGECWELDGVGTHACIVEVCGARLLGTPADEMVLEQPGPECLFTGVWESTMAMAGECFGLLDGVAVELRDDLPPAGETWGPCPITEQGTVNLCNSEDLACVVADNGLANICLPIGECPDVVPLGIFGELGWGDACYPRCGQDSDCFDGQLCTVADADNGSVCAWPFGYPDPGWCCTSFAPDEVCFAAEVPGICEMGSWCPSDIAGAPDCK